MSAVWTSCVCVSFRVQRVSAGEWERVQRLPFSSAYLELGRVEYTVFRDPMRRLRNQVQTILHQPLGPSEETHVRANVMLTCVISIPLGGLQ